MIQERDIEFYVDRRDAGETNQDYSYECLRYAILKLFL